MAKDPVCEMEVDEKTAKCRTTHKGKTVTSAPPGCKEAFEKNSNKYLSM